LDLHNECVGQSNGCSGATTGMLWQDQHLLAALDHNLQVPIKSWPPYVTPWNDLHSDNARVGTDL